MLKLWREMCFGDRFVTILFILAMLWSCHYGIVKGMESANDTYQSIVSGTYY